MRIYIASAYTKGDVAVNIHNVIKAADKLIEKGHIPYIPHLMHFWHLVSPQPYEFWLHINKTIIEHWAEAVLRLPNVSRGADEEVVLAKKLNLPVYYDVGEIE